MKFRYAMYTLVGIYAFNWVAFLLGWYGVWSNLDIPMHFAGGFAAGMFGIAIHHAMTDRHHFKKLNFFYHLLFVTAFVAFVAVTWEFHEYILDNTVAIWFDTGVSQISLGDTMLDLLLGVLGGAVSVFAFKNKL